MDIKHVLVYGMVGDHRGGIETYLLKMNQNMDGNCIFDYVIEEEVCIHEDEIKSHGGRIHFIPSRSKSPLRNIIGNYKLLKRLKYEVSTVYFNLSSLSWIFPILIARLYRYRVFVHSHNADFIAANGSFGYRVVNYFNKRWLHFLNVTRLTCSKPATDFMFMPTDKVEMIYNAINVERFAFNPETRKRKREELGIQEGVFLLGFVGRLQYQKNPLYLTTIMKSLHNNSDIKLIVIGEGDMRAEIEEQLKNDGENRVYLLGNRTDVNELYQAMDLFVLPSYHEGLPFVVVEAQASGLKCCVSEFVTREVNCMDAVSFLPLDKDACNWSTAIKRHKNDDSGDRQLWSNRFHETPFDISKEAIRLEHILIN